MEFAELFKNFGSLFETFQWWSLLLIIGVVCVMVPINILWKKLMATNELSRLRKIVSFVSVYVVSALAVLIFTAIATGVSITTNYLFGSSLALGFCSQFLWEIVKLIRDYGWKRFIAWISTKVDENKLIKELSAKYNIDNKLIKTLIDEAKEQLKGLDTEEIDKVFKENMDFVSSIKNKLYKVVDSNNAQEVFEEILRLVRK